MKNKIIKTVSVVLCAALMCGAAFMGIYAVAANTGKKSDDTTGETVSSAPVVGDTSVTKKETVYVIAGADGSVKKLIVSDWIKNDGKSDILTDVTEAKDIVNVKGDEEYVMGGENTYVWNANGNDIYYQGNIEKELPVSIKITYELNGSVISADEIAGKSGKVKIRFDYINNEVRTVNINGNDEKIYVPFAMLTGIILDTDTFSSVEVSNGKIINDGDRIAVIGIALPGLAESLGADSGKLDIPSYVEITADTKKFSLKNTVTVASNEIFGGLNSENTDALDGKISALTDAVGELTDGSSDLYDGVCTLLDKSTELVDGINKLYRFVRHKQNENINKSRAGDHGGYGIGGKRRNRAKLASTVKKDRHVFVLIIADNVISVTLCISETFSVIYGYCKIFVRVVLCYGGDVFQICCDKLSVAGIAKNKVSCRIRSLYIRRLFGHTVRLFSGRK